MNLERAAMKGKLAELNETRDKLRNRIKGNCTAVRSGLNTTLVEPEEIEIPILSEQFDELKEAWAELIVTTGKISEIEKALG